MNNKSIKHLKRLAEEAYDEDKMSCVVELLRPYLTYCPTDARAWYLYGDAQRVVGVFGAAVVSLGAALKHCPQNVQWTMQARLGLLYSDKGDHVTAERWYCKALETAESPASSWLWTLRAKSMVNQGLLDEAVECSREAVSADPNDDDALLCLATVLRARNQYNPAIAAVKEALRVNPDNTDAESLMRDLIAVQETIAIVAKAIEDI